MDGRVISRVISIRILAGVISLALAGTATSAPGEAMTKVTIDLPGGTMVPDVVAAGPMLEPGKLPPKIGPTEPARETLSPVKAAGHDVHPVGTSALGTGAAAAPGATGGSTQKVEAAPVAGGTKSTPEAGTATAAKTGVSEATGKSTDTPTAAAAIEQQSIRAKNGESGAGGSGAAPKSGVMGGLYSALQVGGALAVVIGLILIGRVIMRKVVPGANVGEGKGVIETLARYPIGRNQSVVLLRIGAQIVALNQTRDASQSILVISEPVEVAKIIGQIEGQDPNSIQQNFNRVLNGARMDLESPETIDVLEANRSMSVGGEEDLDSQLEEMAAAKRQLMELRAQVRSVRDNLPTG